MTITAKYPSHCRKCGQSIAVGSKIEWSRGCPATHTTCPPAPSQDDIADAADRLLDVYDAMQRTAQAAARVADLPKGIYRVSLTGQERRYGIDHINVQIVPNEKYGNAKVSEWQEGSVGRLYPDGRLVYWNDVDRESPRVKAVVAALDIIRGSADPIEFAKAYAAESETCWRCGADLVDELSRERLMGPVCWVKQFGKGA